MMRCDDALEFLLAKCAPPPRARGAAYSSSSFATSPAAANTASSPLSPTLAASARTVMVDLADRSGRTALHYAALLGHAPAVALLLRAGAFAILSRVRSCVLLLSRSFASSSRLGTAPGANPNFADQQGMVPLHTAAAEGHLACVAALLEPARVPQPVAWGLGAGRESPVLCSVRSVLTCL